MNSHTLYDIAFSYERNISTDDRLKLLTHVGSTEVLYKEYPSSFMLHSGRNCKLHQTYISTAVAHDEFMRHAGINVISMNDHEYPMSLTAIPDKPCLIYVRGNVNTLSASKMAAIVGTRKPDAHALQLTKEITHALCAAGFTIVSGLAKGIDLTAHKEALKNNANTIGVLGCGIDRTYPREAGPVIRELLDTGNTVISEYPPGVPPYKEHFPARNRIIAGISQFTVLIQSPEDSGALITVRIAGEYGKDVYILNPENRPGYEGNTIWLEIIPENYHFKNTAEFIEKLENVSLGKFEKPA